MFALLTLIAVASAVKLDSALNSLLQPKSVENTQELLKVFTGKAPWLATNGGILDFVAKHTDQFSENTRAQLDKAHASMDRDAAPAIKVTGARDAFANHVTVRCTAANGDGESTLAGMSGVGFKTAKAVGAQVSGVLRSDRIKDLAGSAAFSSCRLDHHSASSGRALAQSDKASGSDKVRAAFGVTGKGIKVGILSDSFDCLGGMVDDKANGDLPNDTEVLEEFAVCQFGTDEGRAMAQIVHDMAPDASIRFCSGSNGFFQFADCIDKLVEDGCNVIVDDLIYFAEAAFQDDLIAQAANRAAAAGVAYFSSAGNQARESWEGPFVASQFTVDLGAVEAVVNDLLGDDSEDDSEDNILEQFIDMVPEEAGSNNDDDDDDAVLHEFDLSTRDGPQVLGFASLDLPILPQIIFGRSDGELFLTMLHWSDPSPFVNFFSGNEAVGGPNLLGLPGSQIGFCTLSIAITGIDFEDLLGELVKREEVPEIFVDINCSGESNPAIPDFFEDDDDAEFSLDNDDDDIDNTQGFSDGDYDPEPLVSTVAPIFGGLNIMIHVAYSRERHRFPERMKLFFFTERSEVVTTFNPWDTESSTLFGHANAAGAFAVGAVPFFNTPEFLADDDDPIELEPFSSAGGTPILFTPAGTALPAPEIRLKPDFSCVDGVDTTFFGRLGVQDGTPQFRNFFGTSASAPAAAAIAALMLEAQPALSVGEVYKILRETAIDFGDFGFDFDSGFGLCDATAAVQVASNTRPSHVVQAHANSVDFCTSHGVVTPGPCPIGEELGRKRVDITVTGKQRVTIQSHVDYKRLDHKDDVHCGLSATLLVDGRIVWKSSDTTFTRSGSISGLAITDLLDGTHHAEQQVHLLDDKCKVHYSFTNTAIVVVKVEDIDVIELTGLSEDSESSSSSSSSSK